MGTNQPATDLDFLLRGRPILEGACMPYRVFSLLGLTNPEIFPLDIHNPKDTPSLANGMEVGLILPPQLSTRPNSRAVWLPDGRRMLPGERVPSVPAKGWRSLRFRHVPGNPRHYLGDTLPAALCIFGADGMREIRFGLQPLTGAAANEACLEPAQPPQPPPLPAPRYDPSTLDGAFLERLVQHLPDRRFQIMVRGVDPTLWTTRGMEVYARLRDGVPQSRVVEDLRTFFGVGAGDAVFAAVMEVLWPALSPRAPNRPDPAESTSTAND